ncbi:MAG: cytoplasmic dynein with WD40 domain, partial [Paramarteilia canceri]
MDIPSFTTKEIIENSNNLKNPDFKPYNQFNYVERASQAKKITNLDVETMTELPVKHSFKGQVNQWIIHDAYKENSTKEKQLNNTQQKDTKKRNDKNDSSSIKKINLSDVISIYSTDVCRRSRAVT